jgi:hypothetical protein
MRSALLLATYFAALTGSVARAGDALTVLVDGDLASPQVLQAMESEADAALAPSGITLVWKLGHELDGRAVSGQLALVHLRGECRPGSPVHDSTHVSSLLGQTHIVDGQVLPIADILCDAVRKLIDRDLRVAASEDRDKLLGRAIGRVTAHELYHILLRTTSHSHEGLARFSQSAAELLSPRNSFSEPDQRKIAQFALVTGDAR